MVTSERNEKTRRKELTTFTYDLSRCMFCGLCEDACPMDALELTQDFELASYNREGMIWDRQDSRRVRSPPSIKSSRRSPMKGRARSGTGAFARQSRAGAAAVPRPTRYACMDMAR